MRLEKPTAGHISYEGLDLATANEATLRPVRRDIQMVFQDPWASLNPRHTVGQILREPWQIHKGVLDPKDWDRRVAELLTLVGLDPSFARRYPSQFSGGQRQRVSIARALALQPKVLILDEAVSALDVSVQAQILNLLAELQAKLGMAYLFISHDLSVVQHLCHDIGVMYLGRIVEFGTMADVFKAPNHPYTQALLSAMPDAPEEGRIILQGEVPSPLDPPSGCGFRTRCPFVSDVCVLEPPAFTPSEQASHRTACYHPISGT
jgi:oligopeptide/dipeptide ABC transporter ATP-binding protein